MTSALGRLLEAMSTPTVYPYAVETVEVHQTHSAAVFLAGPFAYKIKKPVDLGFLDFSTLEKREYDCREEVRLNRRLAPTVYLGVVPIVQTAGGIAVEGQGGELLEWAVKMRRLSAEATMLARLGRGEVDESLVEELARRVAAFHAGAVRGRRVAACASYAAVARTLREVLERSKRSVGRTLDAATFAQLRRRFDERLEELAPVIESRAGQGVPCEGHGDLHLDHIYHFPEQAAPDDLVIIDCLEFNESLRCLDPVADMAFVVMDLTFHGRNDLAERFARAYFEATGDEEGWLLLPLYAAYRAAVRGSVAGLLLEEAEVPAEQRAVARERASRYWALALRELSEPALVTAS